MVNNFILVGKIFSVVTDTIKDKPQTTIILRVDLSVLEVITKEPLALEASKLKRGDTIGVRGYIEPAEQGVTLVATTISYIKKEGNNANY